MTTAFPSFAKEQDSIYVCIEIFSQIHYSNAIFKAKIDLACAYLTGGLKFDRLFAN